MNIKNLTLCDITLNGDLAIWTEMQVLVNCHQAWIYLHLTACATWIQWAHPFFRWIFFQFLIPLLTNNTCVQDRWQNGQLFTSWCFSNLKDCCFFLHSSDNASNLKRSQTDLGNYDKHLLLFFVFCVSYYLIMRVIC